MAALDLPARLAASLDAPPELYPFLPELFADLEDLGARAEDVVALLREASLPAEARGLDLGCGKGAAALAVARELGLPMHGIDGLPAFVEHARARAARAGVAGLCTFAVGDLREEVRTARGFDLVMLLALGDALGELEETLPALFATVGPGGYVLIDDAFIDTARLRDPGVDRRRYAGLPGRSATLRRLEAAGARVVAERCTDSAAMQSWLDTATRSVGVRAQRLAREHPDLARSLLEFAHRQREESLDVSGPVVGVLRLLRRREDGSQLGSSPE